MTRSATGKKKSILSRSAKDCRAAMEQALEDGFVFLTAVNEEGATSYRYAHPDHSELVITYAPEKR
jgi:hypothetical protein